MSYKRSNIETSATKNSQEASSALGGIMNFFLFDLLKKREKADGPPSVMHRETGIEKEKGNPAPRS